MDQLTIDQSRQTTLLAAFKEAERDDSPEGMQEFVAYCEEHYAPHEVQRARITALVTKLPELCDTGLLPDELKRLYAVYLAKFRYNLEA